MHGPRRHDQGSATILVVALVAVMALSVVAAGRFTTELTDRTRAELAADAAALVGVVGGEPAAAAAAARNGGRLVGFVRVGDDVVVDVVVGTATARARAGP
jgi:hypothetical protein